MTVPETSQANIPETLIAVVVIAFAVVLAIILGFAISKRGKKQS